MKKNRPFTKKQVGQLPRWAQVAFAARCARRVQTLFKTDWPNAPQKHIDAVDAAISIAERSPSAAVAAAIAKPAEAVNVAKAAHAAANAAANAGNAANAIYAAYAAAHAARTQRNTVTAAKSTTKAADVAANCAVAAARPRFTEKIQIGIARDLKRLFVLARLEGWTHKTLVPPEVFGPMWPDGVPEGWPVEQEDSAGRQLVVEIEVPDDATDEQVKAMAREMADRADSLHRVQGGHGLRVADVSIDCDVPVHEGAPV